MSKSTIVRADLNTVEHGGLKFYCREGTSDWKAVREVVERRGYGRYGFTPAAGEEWLDLGANIGAFSVWAASQHPTVLVTAYEPDPEMCELIVHNAKLNGVKKQIDVHQAAVVADRRREVTLHCNVQQGNVWRNSIERHWRGERDIAVPAVHIREVLTATGPGSYLKMDVEGTEMPLLEWMLGTSTNWNLMKRKLQGMVFEWSFDVDRRIERFRNVIHELQTAYNQVRNAQLPDDAPAEWPASWNPPCRVVWAWNDAV